MASGHEYSSPRGAQTPYGSGDPYYNESTGYITPNPVKKRSNNLLKFGIPAALLVIVAVIVGLVVGLHKKNSNSSAASKGNSQDGGGGADGSPGGSTSKIGFGRFATATDSEFQVPIYPSTTNTAAFTSPTFSNQQALAWPADSFQPTTPSPLNVRPDRPRLIAPPQMWEALPSLIASDPYLNGWNHTIFGNATAYYPLPPVVYNMDGPSGILDNAREIKMRVKAFAYVYRLTNDTKWVDRTYQELQNAVSTAFGPDSDDKWNPEHFLDTAELSAAFGIAYDWLNSAWMPDQKTTIRNNLIQYGLQPGVRAFTDPTVQSSFGWWRNNITGNWNCVCNSGLTMGSLAILGDDTTGVAAQLLGLTIDNANNNCALAVSDDGTWAETANYWYFGTTGHAEMASSLMTATGSDYNLLKSNSNFQETGTFHMYVAGATSLFDYGDHGPNKFSTTANCMIFYGNVFDRPEFTLFQREQRDAAEPFSMFWYNPTVSGAFWDGLALDHFFDNNLDQWASMRSSWTASDALYVAMKAGRNQGHETHNDLDAGDFVLDALGTRWAGELGSADYRSPDYFSNDTQTSNRWTYYRKMTEGQNTILINKQNQNVLAAPTIRHDTSGTTQGSSTVLDLDKGSTAYFVADLSTAYFGGTVKRGIRMLNGRKQVLVQDEIDSQNDVQWRMHTNATVTVDSTGTSATLKRDGETLIVSMVNPPQGAAFTTSDAVRFDTDPTPPVPDQENPNITVLIISLPAGQYSLQVLFNPQWSGMAASDYITPNAVTLDQWTLTSHN